MTKKRKHRSGIEVQATNLTAGMTDKMRKERSKEGEVFENTNKKNKQASTDTSRSKDSASTQSASKTSDSENENLQVKLLPEEPAIDYDNDILSCYDNTVGTNSYDTIPSFAPPEKLDIVKVDQPSHQALKIIEYPLTPKEMARQPELVNHSNFMLGTKYPTTALPGVVVQKIYHYGEGEWLFLQRLMLEISTLIGDSGRLDVQLLFAIEKEPDGIPSLKVQLVRKCNPVQEDITKKTMLKLEKMRLEREIEEHENTMLQTRQVHDDTWSRQIQRHFLNVLRILKLT